MTKLIFSNVETKSDFDTFIDIFKESQEINISRQNTNQLYKDLQNNLFETVLAYNINNLVGFIILVKSYSSTLVKKTMYLEEFYIKEEFRNKGLGRLFFKYLIKYLKQNNFARLEWSTNRNNKLALKFYEKYKTDKNTIYYKLLLA